MKYALLLFDNPAAWQDVKPEEMASLAEEYLSVSREPETYGGAQLSSANPKTVRMRDGELLVTDGPFTETKEVLSGLYLIDAESEERALELASRIPTVSRMGGAIELRLVVEREEQP
ncbi:MAG TPA: YciI family protein [Gaiellaceae bacterium]|nr:YciI family protein [Gaiellaceae bacterium]